jgi:hypothetical protein
MVRPRAKTNEMSEYLVFIVHSSLAYVMTNLKSPNYALSDCFKSITSLQVAGAVPEPLRALIALRLIGRLPAGRP